MMGQASLCSPGAGKLGPWWRLMLVLSIQEAVFAPASSMADFGHPAVASQHSAATWSVLPAAAVMVQSTQVKTARLLLQSTQQGTASPQPTSVDNTSSNVESAGSGVSMLAPPAAGSLLRPYDQCGGNGGLCSPTTIGVPCGDAAWREASCPHGYVCLRIRSSYWRCAPPGSSSNSTATNGTSATEGVEHVPAAGNGITEALPDIPADRPQEVQRVNGTVPIEIPVLPPSPSPAVLPSMPASRSNGAITGAGNRTSLVPVCSRSQLASGSSMCNQTAVAASNSARPSCHRCGSLWWLVSQLALAVAVTFVAAATI